MSYVGQRNWQKLLRHIDSKLLRLKKVTCKLLK